MCHRAGGLRARESVEVPTRLAGLCCATSASFFQSASMLLKPTLFDEVTIADRGRPTSVRNTAVHRNTYIIITYMQMQFADGTRARLAHFYGLWIAPL
jgi:hypothetical protein